MTEQETAGVAGNTNYRQWDKVTADLVQDAEKEEELEREETAKALGLDGKYARSHAEAQERNKAAHARKTKRILQKYKKREDQVIQEFPGLLGPVNDDEVDTPPDHTPTEHHVVRITRDMVDAGKRVLTISDTSGRSKNDDLIVLTQDLSHLESKMATNVNAKHYEGDVENKQTQPRSVYGLIKVFLNNLHNCTVSIKCKVISGTVELHHCSNVTLKIEKEATVATLQTDLCRSLKIEFHDAPSGQSMPGKTLYWGEDPNDRIFSAGVSNSHIVLFRDGFVDMETTIDYIKDGAVAVGNASAEEMQFVTSVIDNELQTERVVRHGESARAMTERELEVEKEKREKAVDMAMEAAIRFEETGNAKKTPTAETVTEDEDDVEEVYTSMSKAEIDAIVADCETNKARGNEAFAAGEYAHAILLYSLALDKAEELVDSAKDKFPRHVCLANRSAAFLKMGEHEKALADATRAQEMDPTYVKAIFRRGLALHAMGRYQEAIRVLAEAHKLEPKNKQINQALQFAEVRVTQEMRKRMES